MIKTTRKLALTLIFKNQLTSKIQESKLSLVSTTKAFLALYNNNQFNDQTYVCSKKKRKEATGDVRQNHRENQTPLLWAKRTR